MLVICCVWACPCVSGHAYSWRHLWKVRGWFWVSSSIASPTHFFFFLSYIMYFSWTSDLPFSLYWSASEPPNSAFLYSPPHYWGCRCTQSHLAFMRMFVRSSCLCGKPLTHQAASLAPEFPYIGCFQILSLCAKKTCLEGQDWLCTSLALVPCFPSIKFVR